MGKRVVLVRHSDRAADDRAANWLTAKGFELDIRRPFRGDPLGDVSGDLAGSIVYGGMYNAYDTSKHPFLRDEYHWIDQVLDAGLPLLGICQGAQMIAHHHGAWVGAPESGVHEFGYYEVSPVAGADWFLPQPIHVTQAHYHTFDLPSGATHLARSTLFENQAFCIGPSVFGLQFHAEQDYAGFRQWQNQSDSYGKPGAQSRAEQDTLGPVVDGAQDEWFNGFLDRFMGCA